MTRLIRTLGLAVALTLAAATAAAQDSDPSWDIAPVYNWFTEGFDTKDLQEAKVLLEELE